MLGAAPRNVLRAVGSHGLGPALGGVAVGLIGAVGVGRILGAFLYGVPRLDFVVLAAVAIVVIGIAIGTTYVGARRALAISPMNALRSS